MDGSRPIANLREQRRGTRPGLEPRHLKNIPGRKTDVKDAEWICQLVEHGLVSPSVILGTRRPRGPLPQPVSILRHRCRSILAACVVATLPDDDESRMSRATILRGFTFHAFGCINARKPASVAAFLRPGLSYPSQLPDRRSAYCQLGGHLALAVDQYRRRRARSPEGSPNGKVPVHYYWGVEPHDFVCLFGTSRDEQEPGSIFLHVLLPLPYFGEHLLAEAAPRISEEHQSLLAPEIFQAYGVAF